MSVGTITLEDGVMLGPEVALLTVNHEPKNIRTIMTKEIRIRQDLMRIFKLTSVPE